MDREHLAFDVVSEISRGRSRVGSRSAATLPQTVKERIKGGEYYTKDDAALKYNFFKDERVVPMLHENYGLTMDEINDFARMRQGQLDQAAQQGGGKTWGQGTGVNLNIRGPSKDQSSGSATVQPPAQTQAQDPSSQPGGQQSRQQRKVKRNYYVEVVDQAGKKYTQTMSSALSEDDLLRAISDQGFFVTKFVPESKWKADWNHLKQKAKGVKVRFPRFKSKPKYWPANFSSTGEAEYAGGPQSPQQPQQQGRAWPAGMYPSAMRRLNQQADLVDRFLGMSRTASWIRQAAVVLDAVREVDTGGDFDEVTRSALRNASKGLLAATDHLRRSDNRIAGAVADRVERLYAEILSG